MSKSKMSNGDSSPSSNPSMRSNYARGRQIFAATRAQTVDLLKKGRYRDVQTLIDMRQEAYDRALEKRDDAIKLRDDASRMLNEVKRSEGSLDNMTAKLRHIKRCEDRLYEETLLLSDGLAAVRIAVRDYFLGQTDEVMREESAYENAECFTRFDDMELELMSSLCEAIDLVESGEIEAYTQRDFMREVKSRSKSPMSIAGISDRLKTRLPDALWPGQGKGVIAPLEEWYRLRDAFRFYELSIAPEMDRRVKDGRKPRKS